MPDWAKCGWLAACWLDMELAAYVALQSTNLMVGCLCGWLAIYVADYVGLIRLARMPMWLAAYITNYR